MIKQTRTGPGKFVIGEASDITTFDAQVRSIVLEPNIEKDEAREVLSGDKAPGERTEEWTISGSLLNDFGQEDSLVEFCFENRGKTKPFRFTPNLATGKEITGELTIEPIAIGGDIGETPESDFEFELVGEPTMATIPEP